MSRGSPGKGSGKKGSGAKGPGPKGSGGKGAGGGGSGGRGSGGGGRGRPNASRAGSGRSRSGTGARGASRGGGARPGGNRTPHPAARSASKRTNVGGDQVEGLHAVRELLIAGRRRVHELVVATERSHDPVLDDLVDLASQYGVQVRELGRTKLDALARTTAHQGVVATAAPLAETHFEDLFTGGGDPFLLACDGITDPGNLGALLRTASAAGVTGVVLPRHRSAHVTPAVSKAAAGAIEHLRFAIVGGLPAAIARASERGVVSIGLDMDGDTSVHDLPPADQPTMIVLGAEGRGLSRLVRERCEVVASIPMVGPVESLNVSVAGALAMYEVVRRRR